jgi:ABC-type uncharacterized transport system ATPase subunit
MAAGEKQKLEILKLLYLDQRLLILDEPTSVLTPSEADEMLGLLRGMTAAQRDHRHHDHAQVSRSLELLRQRDGAAPRPQGRRRQGQGSHTDDMARMMIGDTQIRERAVRSARRPATRCSSSPRSMPR